jgi:hypothetical protein
MSYSTTYAVGRKWYGSNLSTALINSNTIIGLVDTAAFDYVINEPQQQRDFCVNPDFSVNASQMNLDGAISYIQNRCNFIVVKTAADKSGDLKLSWSQTVKALEIGPGFIVKQ